MSALEYSSDDFPIHVDLGTDPGKDSPMAVDSPLGKKPKKYYPTLYINGVKGLEGLQKDGWALIEYHRNNTSVNTPEDGDGNLSADLKIKTICLPEPGDSGDDLKTAFAKMASKMGVADAEAPAEDSSGDDEGD